MVGWYNPGLLATTGTRTLLSTLLGSMIDTRRFAAVEGRDGDCVADYSGYPEIWFDYLADTGDGWDATFTVAYLLCSPEIRLVGAPFLPRADYVVLGGDEVYPFASRSAYAERLTWPFVAAAEKLVQNGVCPLMRDLFAIPGNHDWYDSLAAFTARFCSRQDLGCFRTRQARSYFVLRLPFRWEMWCIDIQLNREIDRHQLEFFRRQAGALTPEHQVILCVAEPVWAFGERTREDLHENIERFEGLIESRGAKVRLELAGDIHNYQRYEGIRERTPVSMTATSDPMPRSSYRQTRVVSGGGGAFLHPTHTFRCDAQGRKVGFQCHNRYPDARISRRLSFGVFLFAFKNWKMSSLLGVLYLVFFWHGTEGLQWSTFPLDHPGSILVILIVTAVLVLFADAHSTLRRLVLGVTHGAAHVVMAMVTWTWTAALLVWIGVPETEFTALLGRGGVFLLGGILGGSLLGIYLFVTLNLFGIHENEAFSALRISRYKHFLRCHLSARGLEIFVIGIDRVFSEDAPHPAPTHLIERVLLHNENTRT